MTLDPEVVLTSSGAPAMRDRLTGEVMHPVVGPLVEAAQLYVGPSRLEARLRAGRAADAPLLLLDVGLGAGSNAVAAWRVAESLPLTARRLEIVSFDRSLAALALALDSVHREALGLGGVAGVAARALLEAGQSVTERCTWTLRCGDFLPTLRAEPEASADIVFWDPFSPRASPDHWTVAAFSALRRLCGTEATVHTYSGATATRSALLLAGFFVGTGESVGKGRVTTIAATRGGHLEHPLGSRWLARLARSSSGFPADAGEGGLARVRALPQFAGEAKA